MKNDTIPQYSIWIHKSNCRLVTILGFTKIPEAKTEGIIVGTVGQSNMTFSAEKFTEKFVRYDNKGKK